MKTYSFAICENESIQAEWLQSLVEEYAAQRGITIHVSIWESAEAFLFRYSENKNVDVILLDIQMNELNGMAMAQKLRERDDQVAIVFITGMTEFIGEGYSVEAVDYLIKPVKKEKLFQVLNRSLNKIIASLTYIIVDQQDEQLKVALEEIIAIEVDGRELSIKTDKQHIQIKQSLNEFMNRVDSNQFVQPYRNRVVNCGRIKRVNKGELVMDDGSVVPISRRNQKKMVIAFMNYFRKE